MKKIIIVSPHFPPSNLAAVHRSRLFARHLPTFGWEPVILTVHHKHYEETLDWNLYKLLPDGLRIEQAAAFPIKPFRIIGDIGLRGMPFLLMKLISLVKKEKPDFVYIPIPSFYGALLGRAIHALTGIPYGIDYIDPWVHEFAGSDRKFSRHWWSTKLAHVLEPVAIKKASLITGVAEGYYKPVYKRNAHLANSSIQAAMPYGGEKADHVALHQLAISPYLFQYNPQKFTFIYAGAMLPKAYGPLERLFEVIKNNPDYFQNFEFHFIGTGKSANDADSYNIKPLAEKHGLWKQSIFEYPKRIPYLDVLVHLSIADGIFVLGSMEPHYTPSKVYQGILSEKPVFAVLHQESTASKVIAASKAGVVLTFDGEEDLARVSSNFLSKMKEFRLFAAEFDPQQVDQTAFEQYSAFNVTKILADHLDLAVEKSKTHVA